MNHHSAQITAPKEWIKTTSDCLVVGVYHSGKIADSAKAIDTHGHIAALLKSGDFEGKEGHTHLLHQLQGVTAPRVMLVGLGANDKKTSAPKRAKNYIKALRAVGKALKGAAYTKVAIALATDMETEERTLWSITQGIIHLERAMNVYPALRKEPPKAKPSKTVVWLATNINSAALSTAVNRGVAVARGMEKMLLLANHPANLCTPTLFADMAQQWVKEVAKEHKASPLSIKVLKPEELKKLGMNSFLGVAKGSDEPARMVEIRYNGSHYSTHKAKKKNIAPIVLVGKGITFDSGGISLKPGAEMDHMKWDMTGAATVVGALLACALMKLPLDVVGITPLAENMPSGKASKPSDIVRAMNGLTIENLNTDAEGRLILCDALTYAQREHKPSALIDMATLTGACVVALGDIRMALYANDEGLGAALAKAGEVALDFAWPMPTDEEYLEGMKSNFADIANVSGRSGGSVTAAMFLSKFIDEGTHWAHLDIAGVAYQGTGPDKGATGRPLPLIMQYLMNKADGR